VVKLGEQAWQQRLKHPDYSSTFAELVKLERQRTGLQSQLDELLMTISQQERLKEQLNEGFAARIDEVQAQKRAGAGTQLAEPYQQIDALEWRQRPGGWRLVFGELGLMALGGIRGTGGWDWQTPFRYGLNPV
jgi:hypothetical protein